MSRRGSSFLVALIFEQSVIMRSWFDCCVLGSWYLPKLSLVPVTPAPQARFCLHVLELLRYSEDWIRKESFQKTSDMLSLFMFLLFSRGGRGWKGRKLADKS
jgi:hypothetical protein